MRQTLLTLILWLLSMGSMWANASITPIQLAGPFSSGCVLQRDHTVPVWGTCEPGETIRVAVHEQAKTCVADDEGNWRVVLDAEPASGPFTMTISGERSEQYPVVWRTLVESWREQWGIDFPMYYVQLGPYMKYSPIPKDDDPSARYANLAWLRESQTECRAVPNTEMACIIDCGFQAHAHAPGKDRVGERVARIVAAKTYGIDNVYRGPNVSNVQFEGSDVVITFDNVAGGLETRAVDAQPDADEIAEGLTPVSVSADELAGFALCGSDQVFYWATAAEIISSNQVRISNAVDVPAPVAVRYAWQSYPRCNLYNSEGLPAEPFRTDDYEYLSSGGAQASAAE